MGLDRCLTEKDGIFESAARLQESQPILGTTVAINTAGVLQFYKVESADGGSGLPFDVPSILFANPVDGPLVTDPQTAINTDAIASLTNILQDSGTDTFEGSSGDGAKTTILNRWSVAAVTYTLDESTFAVGDVVLVNKLEVATGVITIITDAGLIYVPDSTSSNTVTMSDVAISARLYKTANLEWHVSVTTG